MYISNRRKSNGIPYSTWFREISAIVFESIGVGPHDMPDHLWRDCYMDDMSPTETLRDAADSWSEDVSFFSDVSGEMETLLVRIEQAIREQAQYP